MFRLMYGLIKNGISDVAYYGKMLLKKVYEVITLILEHCTGDNLIDYKIYGKSEQADKILPSEYQQVEYIESTGSQYIDTGYQANGLTFNCEFAYMPTDFTTFNFVFSARTNSTSNRIDVGWSQNGSTWYGYNKGSIALSNISVADTKIKIAKKTDGKLYVNDNAVGNVSLVDFTPPVNITLFASNNNGNIVYKSYLRMYYFKIYEEDTLVRDLIPCYRKSDNVAGMYDLVNNVFYVNQGTEDDFTVGADVTIPNPDYPQEIYSVGDLVEDETDEHYGKYKIPVNVQTANGFIETSDLTKVSINTNGDSTQKKEKNIVKVTTTAQSDYISGIYTNLSNKVTQEFLDKVNEKKKIYVSFDIDIGTLSKIKVGINSGEYAEITQSGRYIVKRSFISEITSSKWFPLTIYAKDAGNFSVSNIKISYIDDIEYQPYINETKNIYLDAPLRKIGDYADILDFKNRKVTRNVNEDNLATKNWTLFNNTTFYFNTNSAPEMYQDNNYNLFSTHFSNVNFTKNNTHINVKPSTDFISTYSTVALFKQYLLDNNVKFNYILATPTEETIELPDIPTFEGTTIITIGTEIQPSNMWVKYYANE